MKRIILILIAVLTINMIAKAQTKIAFEVSFTEPQAHYVEVQMNISGLSKEYIDLKMPVWQPGSYLIREFAKNVERFTASVAGKTARVQKINKNTWRVFSAKAASVKINYRVYAFEKSVRTSFVDADHAFLSTTGVFVYPAGMLKSPSTVKIIPHMNWAKVSTGLEKVAGDFTYHASDFDILFDSPIEIGNQDTFEFIAAGVPHEVAMYGGGNYNKEKLKVDMAKIIEKESVIFGENPNKRYVFIVHNSESWSGGLEHLNSATLGVIRTTYDNTGGYNRFLSLVAHEYFHLWNVKRLRPVALGPFDYENENYTTNLWISEGFTTYYASKFLLRAGIIGADSYVSGVANSISLIENSIGAKEQSAAAGSFDAWIIQYRPNENSSNNSISYYSKGAVIAAMIDLEISNSTNGMKNLDDVMKGMYLQCKALKRGFTDAEFKAMVEKISGKNFSDFWARYVNGTAAVDYEKYFSYAGVKVVDENAGKRSTWFGATTRLTGAGIVVTSVARGSAAWADGINVNDEILTVNGLRVDDNVERMLANRAVGDLIKVAIVRDGVKRDVNVTLTSLHTLNLKATVDPNATRQQQQVLKGWLRM